MVEHNANLPSVQADQQARKNAARELLYDFVDWWREDAPEPGMNQYDPPHTSDVDRYLEEVDRG